MNVFDFAKKSRGVLYASRTQNSRLLVSEKGARHVAVMLLETIPQANCIFERLARALGDVLKHWVRGISEQGDAVARPVGNREAIEHRPAPIPFNLRDSLSHPRT